MRANSHFHSTQMSTLSDEKVPDADDAHQEQALGELVSDLKHSVVNGRIPGSVQLDLAVVYEHALKGLEQFKDTKKYTQMLRAMLDAIHNHRVHNKPFSITMHAMLTLEMADIIANANK